MKNHILVFFALCLVGSFYSSAQQAKLCVKINEVNMQPDGGVPAQITREWIELYNYSTVDTIDVAGWFMQTDVNNNVNYPNLKADEIVAWEKRNPGTTPNDITYGPLVTNTTRIPPNTAAVILDPTWNDDLLTPVDIPDNTIALTVKTYLNWGSNGILQGDNGRLHNLSDMIVLTDGNPALSGVSTIDSVAWHGTMGYTWASGLSLQRAPDCVFRWQGSAGTINYLGYDRDTTGSIFAKNSIGSQNFGTGTGSSCFCPVVCTAGFSYKTSCNSFTIDFSDASSGDPVTWSWFFGDSAGTSSAGSPSHTYSQSGTYTVTMIISNGSTTDTLQQTVYLPPFAAADAGMDTTIEGGSTAVLHGSGGIQYSWFPGNNLSCTDCAEPSASPLVTTTYWVITTDANGCTASDSVTVTVLKKKEESLPCGTVFIPNAFSPNGDGVNDLFAARGSCIASFSLTIYNRWGERIFVTDDLSKGWDGSWKGTREAGDVFAYRLHVVLNDGATVSRDGNVSLVR